MAQKETRTIFTMGDSLGITLPYGWLNYNNIKAGDKVEIITYGTTAEIKLLNNNYQPKNKQQTSERKQKVA